MLRRAFITGIMRQDDSNLADLLLGKLLARGVP
jgi:hypothetical protein